MADLTDHGIRRIDIVGTMSTLAGTGVAGCSGEHVGAAVSRLNRPQSVEVDASGRALVEGLVGPGRVVVLAAEPLHGGVRRPPVANL